VEARIADNTPRPVPFFRFQRGKVRMEYL
jgi:hypothetical protein